MMFLKQSTAVDIPIGPFLDETDGKTAETALTITQPDIRLKKNGGAWAQKNASQTLSHEENGWYEVSLDTTDTNTLGHLVVAVHESGALPVWREFMVLPAMIYDALVAGSDRLDTNVTHVGDTAQTAGNIIGVTNDIQARLPAALVSGRMDASVGAMAANTLTASALAADAVAEIAAGGVGVTIARSTGALIGTSESSGVTIAAGATETGSEVDVLGGTDSIGELSVYLVFATTGTSGTVEVRLRHARVTGQPSAANDMTWQVGVMQEGKMFLGRVKATRYMSAVVVNRIAGASLTDVAVLYELEKQS